MKGLIIKDPWITKILNGEKVWEIRSSNTNIRGRVALIKSKTGKIFGSAELVGTKLLSPIEVDYTFEYHQVESREDVPYKHIWAWIFEKPLWHPHPIGYQHPQGAVIWVNL